MSPDKTWYAVYTRPRSEKKTALLLQDNRIETYCPLNKVVRHWADRKKIIQEPLFTSYCFVHISAAEYRVVRETQGVINFVYWLGKPAVIREDEISAIRHFMNEYPEVKMEPIGMHLHDQVRIMSGPLMAQEGCLMELRNHSARILLPGMGVALIAEVAQSRLAVIKRAGSRGAS